MYILRQLCEALEEAHGLVHRDIKVGLIDL